MQKCLFAALLTLTITSCAFAQDSTEPEKSRALGSVSNVKTLTCPKGGMSGATCQSMTVTCPSVSNISAYVKTNTPSSPKGTAVYGTGGDGGGLYDTQFTYGKTAVQNVYNAGFRTVQMSFGSPFTTSQPNGWVEGPGGVLEVSCRYATVIQWIYNSIQNKTSIPMCATANSGGAGGLAYALSQYGSNNVISMAEVTGGPPTARLDWGCMCQEGKIETKCGQGKLGTCFGTADAGFWDPAYTPNNYCSNAVKGTPPPGGSTFFLDDSVEAPGANYKFSTTFINVAFGTEDTSSAVPAGENWYNLITTNKAEVCVTGAAHSMADSLAGADQIANDLINLCKIQ